MTKAIIFDWGGVLIDSTSRKKDKYCADVLGVDFQEYNKVREKNLHDFDHGFIEEGEFWRRICHQLGVDEPKTKSLWGDAVREVFNEKNEMFEWMAELKRQGYKIGFLSNTEMPAVEYWKENDYEKYFDEAVFSCVEHIAKPEPEIYELICKRLGVLPEEVIFIDDKQEFIKGAKNVGMKGVVFENCQQVKSDTGKLIGNM